VWDATTGQEVLVLGGHKQPVHCVCFGEDGQRLATGSADQTVRIWDAQTGKELLCLVGHSSPVIGVCFSPDGRQIISREFDGRQITWNLATGQPATAEGTYRAPSTSRSPDGRFFALREDVVIRIHRLPTVNPP
jgi:WD40 repeat protein